MWEQHAIPAALGLLALALSLAQQPGRAYHDTRIELAVDPGLFLHRVASVWSSSTDLGHVQSGQWVGYLWPVAPYYSLAQWMGLPTWVSQRLWLALLMGLAGWGVVRLMDELYDRRRGLAHLVAGGLYAFSPYVVTYADRTATLLAYTALPWLMVVTHRSLGRPRSWIGPVIAGLIVTSAGGGLNAALLAWVLVAPLALIAYEVAVLGRDRRDGLAFLWRAAICVVLASLWWLVPVLLQSRYGENFLSFTEQPATILVTPSASESFRLLGLWLDYFGLSFGTALHPSVPGAAPYLFSATTIVGSFAVPLLAFGALRWTRRWVYAPFLGLMGAFAVVVMAIGFPPRSHINHVVTSLYYDVPAVQFLRTTYKAAPLLALSLGCLGGAGTVALLARLRVPGIRVLGTRIPVWSALVLAAIPVLWARPLVARHLTNPERTFKTVPDSWRAAVRGAGGAMRGDRRIMVIPGEHLAWYRWAGTDEPVGPALSRLPVVIHQTDRYADPRSAQLLASIDELIQQGRLVPGQLEPLLQLMGIGQVLVPTDGVPTRNGALDPARVSTVLERQGVFDHPAAQYGPRQAFSPSAGWSGPPVALAQLRRYSLPAGPGIVRAHARAGAILLDGDAEGVVELAADGALNTSRALISATAVDRAAIARRVREGAELVFSDSNRKRRLASVRLTEDHGPTLGPSDPIPREDPTYDPFPSRGNAGRTVALYSGLRYLRANATTTSALHPPTRPYAAFDRDPTTAWIANGPDDAGGFLELALSHPRPITSIDVLPHFFDSSQARLGVSVNDGPERVVPIQPGHNRITLSAAYLDRLRLRLASPRLGLFGSGVNGISEVRVPGLRVREALRLPTDLASATRGLDLTGNPLTLLLARTTTDFPYRTGALAEHPLQTNGRDAEPGMVREVDMPAARRYAIDGWASADPRADASRLDRLAGLPTRWRFRSSSRFEGVPGRRASSAFDSDPHTAWVADRIGGAIPWLSWQSPRHVTFSRFRLVPGPAEYAFPTRLRVSTTLGPLNLQVGARGLVRLPRPITASGLRIDVLGVRRPAQPQASRRLRAVAIGEVVVPGLNPPRVRSQGHFASPCGELTVSAGRAHADVRVIGSLADLDAGRPLRLAGCGPRARLSLPAGPSTLVASRGTIMRPDHLRLHSAALRATPPAAVGTIIDAGSGRDGERNHVRVSFSGPGWLVLGESYSSAWRAWCSDRSNHEYSLGRPVVADGFANGWAVDSRCRQARFAFAPQAAARWTYLISAGAIALMLTFLAMTVLRSGRRSLRSAVPTGTAHGVLQSGPARSADDSTADPPRQLSWRGTVISTVIAGGALSALYGGSAGLMLAAILVVLGREGISVQRLIGVTTIALAALPVIYLASPAVSLAGTNFDYSIHHIAAHRVAAVAVACLLGACALELRRVRADRLARRPEGTRR